MTQKHIVIQVDPNSSRMDPYAFSPVSIDQKGNYIDSSFRFKIPGDNGWIMSKLYAVTCSGEKKDVTLLFRLLDDTLFMDMKNGSHRRVFKSCLCCGIRKWMPDEDTDPFPNLDNPWHCDKCESIWKRVKPNGITRFEPEWLDAVIVGGARVRYGDASDHNGGTILGVIDGDGKEFNVTPCFKYLYVSPFRDTRTERVFELCLRCGGRRSPSAKSRYHCNDCSKYWADVEFRGPITFKFGPRLNGSFAEITESMFAQDMDGQSFDVTNFFRFLLTADFRDNKTGAKRRVFFRCLRCNEFVHACTSDGYPNTETPWHCDGCDKIWRKEKPPAIVYFHPKYMDERLVGNSIVRYGDGTDHNGSSVLMAIDSRLRMYDVTPYFKYILVSEHVDTISGRRFFNTCLRCGRNRPESQDAMDGQSLYHCNTCSEAWERNRPIGSITYDFAEKLGEKRPGKVLHQPLDMRYEKVLHQPLIISPQKSYHHPTVEDDGMDFAIGSPSATWTALKEYRDRIPFRTGGIVITGAHDPGDIGDSLLTMENIITHGPLAPSDDDEPVPTVEEIKTLRSDEESMNSIALEEKKEECAICMDKRPDVIYIKCGHLCICQGCLKAYTGVGCPICRTEGGTLIARFN